MLRTAKGRASLKSWKSDIFLVLGKPWCPSGRMLSEFARHGMKRIYSWGIAGFVGQTPRLLRSSARTGRDLNNGFADACETLPRSVVIGRIQTITCGTIEENQQPSGLAFLGRDWVFVHDAPTDCGFR
jgi:hypothetical protein